MARCLLHLQRQQTRRLPPQNPHPTNSMPTSRFRPSTLAMRILMGVLAVIAFIAGDRLRAGSIAQQQENPNRPPWAQKSKSAGGSSAPGARAEAGDPPQD